MTRRLLEPFASPWFLAATLTLLAAGGAAFLLAASRLSRRRAELVSPALAARSGLMRSRAGAISRALLVAAAILGVGIALARPRWGFEKEEAHRKGTDVVVVLDTSASMRAADVTPSRFVLARQAALSLLSRLPEDRVALVACEGDAQVLVPLTLDAAAAALFLEALEPGVGTIPGTSLAAGIQAAAELFPAGPSGSRQCVVISDGEDLEGGVDDAAAKAKKEGIVVHTVLVGAEKGAPVPEYDVAGRMTGYKVDASGAPVLSHANADLLRKLAAATGGSFSKVSPGRTDLDGAAREIDRAARRPLDEAVLTNRPERYQLPLAIGVVAAALLLVGRPAIRFPWPLRRRKGSAVGPVAASVLMLAIALSSGPAPLFAAGEPTPATAPASAATRTFWQRILSYPPFTTARGEAKKGARALEEKNVEQAVAHFSKQKELAPAAATADFNLGTALSRAGKMPEAVASLESARKAGSRDLARDAAYNEGKALYSGGDWAGSAAAFRKALRLAPGDPDASWNYELALRRAEEQKKKDQQKQNDEKDKQGKNDKEKSKDKDKEKKDPQAQKNEEQQKQEQEKERQAKEDQEFRSKANMSKEKADQLLAAIANADREEQRRKMAEQRKQRRVTRDW
jgi:Ca-activated chloride channel family protein